MVVDKVVEAVQVVSIVLHQEYLGHLCVALKSHSILLQLDANVPMLNFRLELTHLILSLLIVFSRRRRGLWWLSLVEVAPFLR